MLKGLPYDYNRVRSFEGDSGIKNPGNTNSGTQYLLETRLPLLNRIIILCN